MLRIVVAIACVPFLVLPALVVAQVPPADAAKAPRLELGKDRVDILDVTPGGEVVLVAIGRSFYDFTMRFHRVVEGLEDSDRDGTVTLDYPLGIPEQSVWVAVDLASAEVGFQSASARAPRRSEDPRFTLRRPGAGRSFAMQADRRRVFGLLVRKGVGAWWFVGGDGTPGDVDGVADGRLDLELDDAEPVPGKTAGKPPEEPGKDDVVVLFDLDELEFVVVPGSVLVQRLGGN